MSIIVAGKLILKSGFRDTFIEQSREAILMARSNSACGAFSVSPDPIDSNRVNIFEKWQTRSALHAFRSEGLDSDIFSLVESFDVQEYDISP